MLDTELIDNIKAHLGAPKVKVELDDTQWKHVVDNTKRWFLAKKGIIASTKRDMTVGTSVSFADIDPTYGVDKILDVYFGVDPSLGDFYKDTAFGVFTDGFPVVYGSMFGGGRLTNMSRYAQLIMALEERRRVFGSEWDWFDTPGVLGAPGTLTIDGVYDTSTPCIIIYKPKLKPANLNLAWLTQRDLDLVIEWATAEAKEFLGRVRGKYGSYQTPGGEVNLDADKLLEESKDEKERLNQEIFDSQGPMGFLTG